MAQKFLSDSRNPLGRTRNTTHRVRSNRIHGVDLLEDPLNLIPISPPFVLVTKEVDDRKPFSYGGRSSAAKSRVVFHLDELIQEAQGTC